MYKFWDLVLVSDSWFKRYEQVFIAKIDKDIKAKYITIDKDELDSFAATWMSSSLWIWVMIKPLWEKQELMFASSETDYYRSKYELEKLCNESLKVQLENKDDIYVYLFYILLIFNIAWILHHTF